LWALRVERVNVLAGKVEVVQSASEKGGWQVARCITTTSAGGTSSLRSFVSLARRSLRPRCASMTRHSCAAFLIDAGRSLHEVKDHLGHSSIRVTSDRYGHLYPEARAALADALDAVYRDAPAASPQPDHAIAHLPRRATAAP
jgi:hypothetical protein